MTTPVDNVVPLTGNPLIDGLTWGAAWQFDGAAHTLSYSLSLNDTVGNQPPWTWSLSDAARRALTEWSNVANLSFVEVGGGEVYNQSSADLVFLLTGNEMQTQMAGLVALGLPPSPSYIDSIISRAGYPQPEGDIALDNSYNGFSYLYPGDVGLTIMLHEIGHALGLKHTDNGPAGRPNLPSLYDSNLYTVMSYTDAMGNPLGFHPDSGNAATPMLLDILAIQHIYGANTSYHTGDDAYYVQSLSGNASNTIWDAGGNDTLSVTLPNFLPHADALIDLREGHYSSILGTTVAIAYNVTIENAAGSDGNDRLTGNVAANRLDGDVGNDTLEGGAGNDTLDGGVGADIANYLGSMSGYSFGVNASNQVTITDIDPGNGDDGTDTFVRTEQASFIDGTVSLRSYDETTVNTFRASDQARPAIALTTDGGYVITWTSSYQGNDSYDIYAQRYDAIGHGVGGETRVNTYTPQYQGGSAIATLADGDYVITWQSLYQDGYDYGIYAQRYDTNGNTVGGETRISTYAASSQMSPAIAALADGGYVVAWESYNQSGIFAQRYDPNGNPLGGETQVDVFAGGSQVSPAIAGLADGGYVVTWRSLYQDYSDGSGIYARRYDASGNAVGSETRINAATVPDQLNPAISALKDGGYVVAWQSFGQDGSQWGIYAQRYDMSGNAVGAEMQVNATTTGTQDSPTIAGLADGGFLVTWSSFGVGTFAQRYDAGGNPVGGETLLTKPSEAIAALPGGGYVVTGTWFAGGDNDVAAQRYDADGNAVYQLTGDANANQMTWADSTGVVFDGAAGNDTLTGGSGADVLNGGLGADNAAGGDGNDFIIGGAGSDTLNGGAGADTLTGGSEADFFVIDNLANVDTITDFSPVDDTLVLTGADVAIHVMAVTVSTVPLPPTVPHPTEPPVMEPLPTAPPPPTIPPPPPYGLAALILGVEALDANGYVIYDRSSGALYFDADGPGAIAPVQFAALAGAPAISLANLQLNGNHLPSGTVGVGGTAIQGQTLTASNTLADGDGLGTISYLWVSSSDGTNWTYAGLGNTLALDQALVGQQIKVLASYTDGHGSIESIASAATPKVTGYQAGSAGNESLIGTSYADTLLGLAGNDTLAGGSGNDTLAGGAGDDNIILSLAGAVNGGVIDGGDGNDTITLQGPGWANLSSLDVFLDQANGIISGPGFSFSVTNVENLSINVGEALTISNWHLSVPGNLILDAGDVTVNDGSTLNAGQSQVITATGDITITGGSLSAGQGQSLASGGNIAVTAGGSITVGGNGADLHVSGPTASASVTAANLTLNGQLGFNSDYSSSSVTLTTESVVGTGNLSATATNGGTLVLAGLGEVIWPQAITLNGSLTGTSYADTLLGVAGNDTLNGGAGNDHLKGGAGFDTAQYSGNQADYAIAKSVGYGYTITDTKLSDGNDGTDTLFAVEHLQFADGAVDLVSRILERVAPPAIWRVVDSRHDFNGDGTSDQWWEQSGGSGGIWVMDGTNPVAPQTVSTYTGWSVTDAASDFNGDGKADLAWQQAGGGNMQWINAVDLAAAQGIGSAAGWSLS